MTASRHLPHMGFEPHTAKTPEQNLDVEAAHDFAGRITSGVPEAKAALMKAKGYYDRRCAPALELKLEDWVWLDASDIKMTRPSVKLSDRRLGLFKVLAAIERAMYKLELPQRYSQLHLVFPIVKLQLVEPKQFPGHLTYDEPPPEIKDGHKEWEVQEILEAKICWGILWYIVWFKGYDSSYNEWVKPANLFAKDTVAEYYQRNPGAPRAISIATMDGMPFK